MEENKFRVEAQRVSQVYSQRGYDNDKRYSDVDLTYLHRVQSIEKATLMGLKALDIGENLDQLKILDYGCGNGRWIARWIAWGANSMNFAAVDIREDAVEMARRLIPLCVFNLITENGTGFQEGTFDLIYQNLVFSSILDDVHRRAAAEEMARLLKPGGAIMWCDFTFDNPGNPDVKKVTRRDLAQLFPGFEVVFTKRLILAPPIARRVVPVSWFLADCLETLPFLRTHLFAVLRKI